MEFLKAMMVGVRAYMSYLHKYTIIKDVFFAFNLGEKLEDVRLSKAQ